MDIVHVLYFTDRSNIKAAADYGVVVAVQMIENGNATSQHIIPVVHLKRPPEAILDIPI